MLKQLPARTHVTKPATRWNQLNIRRLDQKNVRLFRGGYLSFALCFWHENLVALKDIYGTIVDKLGYLQN